MTLNGNGERSGVTVQTKFGGSLGPWAVVLIIGLAMVSYTTIVTQRLAHQQQTGFLLFSNAHWNALKELQVRSQTNEEIFLAASNLIRTKLDSYYSWHRQNQMAASNAFAAELRIVEMKIDELNRRP